MRNCTCIKNKTVSACLRNEDHPHLSITLSLKLHCSDCPFFTAAFLETSLFTPPFLHSVPLSLKLHSSDHPSVYSTFLETPLFRSPFFQCLFPWNPTPQITLLSTPLFLKPHSLDHPSSNTSFPETPLFRSPTSFNATFLSKKPHSLYVYLSVNKPLTKYHISVQATLKRLQSAFAEKWFHCSNMFRHRVKKKSSPTFGVHCNVTCLQHVCIPSTLLYVTSKFSSNQKYCRAYVSNKNISVQATLKRLQSAFAEKWFHCSNMFRHRVKKKSSPTFGVHCNVTCLQRNLSTA